MRIVLATPLYPPEVADAAAYAKELARRLSEHHQVTVVAYAHLPEELPGVRVIPIDKRAPRHIRVAAFRGELARAARGAEIVIAINGASVELPLLASPRMPIVFSIADQAAHKRSGVLEALVRGRARAVIRDVPPAKPEILPLLPRPETALKEYERAWDLHLSTLSNAFGHA